MTSDIASPAPGSRAAGRLRAAGPAQAVVLVAVAWLAVVAAGVLAPVLPKMAEHFAGAQMLGLMIGFVATIPSLGVALFSAPLGQLSDRIGARRILVVGMSGYGLAGLLPLWLDSLPAIVASRFVVGVCEAAVMTASTTLISLYFDGPQRNRWLAAQVASTNVIGVVVVLAGGVAGQYGWRAPFFAYAIALVLLLPVLLLTYEPDKAAAVRSHPAAVYSAAQRRLVLLRCAMTFIVSVTIYALIVQLSFLLAERGVSQPAAIGPVIACGAGGIALGSIANTVMLATSPRLRLSAAGLLMTVGLGLIAVDAHILAMCAGAVAAGIGAGVAVSTLLCITVADAPAGLKGQVTGAWTAAMFLGQFLNPPIFLALARLGGSYGAAFLIYAAIIGMIAIGGAAVAALPRPLAPRDSREPGRPPR